MSRLRRLPVMSAAALLISAPALAAGYPVSGAWTYDYSPEKGPANQCGNRRMEFSGDQRRDTGGGVPTYRNVSVTEAGSAQFRIVDEFATGQINARLEYSLRLIDDDHLEIKLASGPSILLRRCA